MSRVALFLAIIIINAWSQSDSEFDQFLHELSGIFYIAHIVPDSVNMSDAIILDAREKEEYNISRLKDAIWVGYNDFNISRVDTIDRSSEIIVYCSVGYRSSEIVIELHKAGFLNVKNLYGGIFRWANKGYPIFNNSSQTKKIHIHSNDWGRFITNPVLVKVY
jgi:rhodanese-related sulfurtransferase